MRPLVSLQSGRLLANRLVHNGLRNRWQNTNLSLVH